MSDVVLQVENLHKNYQALRPLRVQSLTIKRAEMVSLVGLDAAAAEMLVGLLTGAVLPDEGRISLLGQSTGDVTNTDAWLAMLDQVGIVTDRAVLIAQFSVEQNIAIPFTLQVDPVAPDVKPQVAALAREVGLGSADLDTRVAEAAPGVVARVRLARALALDPVLLMVEHPSASLRREDVKPFAEILAKVAKTRTAAVLAITADEAFATALGGNVLLHEPATGALKPQSRWRKIFG